MTSEKNNDDTVKFFKDMNYFGYDKDYVDFFVQEMAPASTFDGKIYLLPALPDKWSDGSVRGLLAKGNIKVDMTWSGGKLTSYSLTGKGKANIVYGGKETVHELDGGTLTVEL